MKEMDLKILGLAAIVLAGVIVVAAGAHGTAVFGKMPAMPHSEAAWKKIAGNEGSHEKMHAAMHGENGDHADGREMKEMHERMHGTEPTAENLADMAEMHEKMHGGGASGGGCQSMDGIIEGGEAPEGMKSMHG